jgi:hypothetical protein
MQRKNNIINKAKLKPIKDLNCPDKIKGAGYQIHLKSFEDVRRLLSETINGVRQNKISENKGKTIGYLANIMLSCLELATLEDRIIALEETVAERNL